MRRLPAAVLLLPVLTLTLWAEDEKKEKQKPKTAPALKMTYKAPRALRGEDDKATKGQEAFDALAEELEEKVNQAEKPADRQEVFTSYTRKFLDHAKAYAKDPSAVDALVLVLTLARPAKDEKKDSPRVEAMKLLESDYVRSPAIAPHLRKLVHMGDDFYEVVKEVAKGGADKRTQALAFRALISARNRTVRTVEALEKNANLKANYEKMLGKDKVALMVENAPKYLTEIKAYRNKLLKGNLKGILADVSVGATAP